MAGGAEASHCCIYEKREEDMVSTKDGKQKRRVARFLKPCAITITKAVAPPKTPLLCEVFPHNLQQWPSRVFFRGWKMPQKKWDEWVDRLAGNYCSIWNQSGICDAILSSKFEIRCNNKDIVLGLVEFWSSETNTFVFPWGEATVTLEDVMVLGGLSALGSPVTRPTNHGVLLEIVEEMEKKRLELGRTKARKACHGNWLKHFMELPKGYNFEHVAFLSLWLSRFVFPSLHEESMGRHVFPIAAHLSQGKRLALGPAVLSGLYKDLSLMKKQALSCVEEISAAGQFQLLQLWALERFQPLLQSPPKALKPGEPRAARWHKLNARAISLPLVRTVFKLQENFQWRPYAAGMSNWRHSAYYRVSKVSYFDSAKHSDENLQSYVRCLCTSELVGVENWKEWYFPHRVAMQFGMDQDLPGEFSGLNFASNTNVRFLVPPRFFEPGVSARYLKWWKESNSARADAIKKDVIVATHKIKKCNASTAERNSQTHKATGPKHQGPEKAEPAKNPAYVNRQASATPRVPKQVNKETPPDHTDDIPVSTLFISSTSQIPDANVEKQKLGTTTEKFPAKEGNAGDFAKKLIKIAKKGRKAVDRVNVQVQKHKMGAKVSETVAVKEGSLKNPMGVDDRKRKESQRGAVKQVKKRNTEGIFKNPVEVDHCLENAARNPVGLLTRVEHLEKILLGRNREEKQNP